MNDIDFDAIDQAVNNQLQGQEAIPVQTKKKEIARGRVMDVTPMRAVKSARPPMAKKIVKPVERKTRAVSKTISDIFPTSSRRFVNQIKPASQPEIKINPSQNPKSEATTIKTQPHSNKSIVRQRQQLRRPSTTNRKLISPNGTVIGNYQSKTIAKESKDGTKTIYKQDVLNYKAELGQKTSQIDQQAISTIKPISQAKTTLPTKKTNDKSKPISVASEENKAPTPFIESAQIKKRPLGTPVQFSNLNNKPINNPSPKFKPETPATTPLYRADKKIADTDCRPKTGHNKLAIAVAIIVSLIAIGLLIWWSIEYYK